MGKNVATDVRLFLYGVIPLCVGLAFMALAFLGRDTRLTVLNLAFSGAIAILAAETYLAFNPEHVRFTFKGDGLHIATDDRAKDSLPFTCGSSFVPNGLTTSDGKIFLPLGGLTGVFLGRENDDPTRPRFADEFGFNNPNKEWPKDGVELVTIGDSFTYGADVLPGHGYVDLLRGSVSSLVNLGCGGNGPLLELAALSEYGPYLKPRRIVWAYYEENDLPKDIVDERTSPILMAYLNGKTQNLVEQRSEIEATLRAFLTEQAQAKSIGSTPAPGLPRLSDILFLRSLRSSIGLINGFAPESLELFGRILRQARALAANWGGEITFVYLPGPTRYTNKIAQRDADGFKALVLREVSAAGLTSIDIDSSFRQLERPIGLFRGHYNEEGYRRVAETISTELKLPPRAQ